MAQERAELLRQTRRRVMAATFGSLLIPGVGHFCCGQRLAALLLFPAAACCGPIGFGFRQIGLCHCQISLLVRLLSLMDRNPVTFAFNGVRRPWPASRHQSLRHAQTGFAERFHGFGSFAEGQRSRSAAADGCMTAWRSGFARNRRRQSSEQKK